MFSETDRPTSTSRLPGAQDLDACAGDLVGGSEQREIELFGEHHSRPRIECVNCVEPGSFQGLGDQCPHWKPFVDRRQGDTDLGASAPWAALATCCQEPPNSYRCPVKGEDLDVGRRVTFECTSNHEHPTASQTTLRGIDVAQPLTNRLELDPAHRFAARREFGR